MLVQARPLYCSDRLLSADTARNSPAHEVGGGSVRAGIAGTNRDLVRRAYVISQSGKDAAESRISFSKEAISLCFLPATGWRCVAPRELPFRTTKVLLGSDRRWSASSRPRYERKKGAIRRICASERSGAF